MTEPRPSARPKYITGPNAADTVAAASVDYSIGFCQLRRATDILATGGAGAELTQEEIEKAVDLARQGLQTMVACASFVGRVGDLAELAMPRREK